MANAFYQTTVKELEAILAPRVVSRSLHEGLQQLGVSPDAVGYGDIEKVLKLHIYKRLQVSMPVAQAKEKIGAILDRLQKLAPDTPSERPGDLLETQLEAQGHALESLKEALKPFNLYFEWPETQKLRAQLQLIERKQQEGEDASQLVTEARAQLQRLHQKLADQLVGQARDLLELEADLTQVRGLGGPKVRRLETLIGQIANAQQAKQLAGGEVERAGKLATELRKLMESSVVVAKTPADPNGDTLHETLHDMNVLSPEVSARLTQLDVAHEGRELETLAREYSTLLEYQGGWQTRFAAYQDTLAQDASLGETLTTLRHDLAAAQTALRQTLTAELHALMGQLETLEQQGADVREAYAATQVALGVLATTLPSAGDIQQARDLGHLAQTRAETAARERQLEAEAERAKLTAQADAVAALTQTLERYRGSPTPARALLETSLCDLGLAQQGGRLALDSLQQARQAEQLLLSSTLADSSSPLERERVAVQKLLGELETLPLVSQAEVQTEALRRDLKGQLVRLQTETIGSVQIDALTGLLTALKGNLKDSYARQLSDLGARATLIADKPSLEALRQANETLEAGHYPDLVALERSIRGAFEARRQEQLAELHQLDSELYVYRTLDETAVKTLSARLQDAKAELERGILSDLSSAWALLEEVRRGVAQRLESFGPRLDKALQDAATVSMLNSDEASSVRRILTHLDSQRAAFAEVSPGVQTQLYDALQEAETLIKELRTAFDATRAIADQLVSGNVLDDILGIFGEAAETPPGPTATPPADVGNPTLTPDGSPPGTWVRSDDDTLNAWLDSFLEMPSVHGAALFNTHGGVVSGRLGVDPQTLNHALGLFERDMHSLGDELALTPMHHATLETPTHALVVAWPNATHRVAFITDAGALVGVLGKVQDDLGLLQEQLGAASLA